MKSVQFPTTATVVGGLTLINDHRRNSGERLIPLILPNIPVIKILLRRRPAGLAPTRAIRNHHVAFCCAVRTTNEFANRLRPINAELVAAVFQFRNNTLDIRYKDYMTKLNKGK